jgi:signal transduction histidine kinase
MQKWVIVLAMLLGLCSVGIAQPKDGLFRVDHGWKDNGSFSLDGEWQFVWGELVDPKQTTSIQWNTVQFPLRWTAIEFAGKHLPANGVASYQLKLLLPEKSQGLGINMPDVYTSYALYLNGELLGANGKPHSDPQLAVPRWERKLLPIPDGLDSLHLVLHIANHWHSKGGPYKSIWVGDLATFKTQRQLDNAYDLVLFGCLLMGGLYFLGLYSFGKQDKVILFFALFCLTYAYRIIGSHNYVLHQLLPDISWFVSVRLEYISLFTGIGFFCLYTLRLYPVESSKRIMWTVVGINATLALLSLLSPPAVFTTTITPFLVLMFGFTFYTFWVYYKAYRNKRLGSGYALWSTAVVLVVMLLINFQYFGIIMPAKIIVFIGYLLFFFLQSLILSYRFAEQLDKARRDAEYALKIKSEFLSTMSHEIRTPLNSVIGMTHLLLKDKPRADQQEQLNVLLFSARNLLSIVNDILDYNKIEAGKISLEKLPVDINMLAQNVFLGLKSQGEEKQLTMRLKLAEELKYKLMADPVRISQILVNLLHNAIKFTHRGYVALTLTQLAMEGKKRKLRFEVSDSGIGIALDKQKMIFDRFTQADSSTSRSFGGTGLGLSIAQSILALYNSRLTLESKPDEGACFYFDLWLEESDEAITEVVQSQEDLLDNLQLGKPLQNKHILLVEDNALNVMVAKSFLQRWGAYIDVANHGEEALEKLNAQKHQLVLMDLHMPVMDGYEATRRLRARGESLPIIALTASLPKDVEHEAFAAGVNAVVVKPFDPDDLRQTIVRFLQ